MSVTLLASEGKETAIQLPSLQTPEVQLEVVREGNHISFSVYDQKGTTQYDFDLGEGKHADLALEYLGVNLMKKLPPVRPGDPT